MHVLAIVGPTASGKTGLGIALSKGLGGEVVSGDSRQVYRGLDLGTGKVTVDEAGGVPHHLIDVADPSNQYTVHDFVHAGRGAISDIASRGRVPIVVGGTGLYIDALLGRMTLDAPPPDPALRARLSRSDLDTLVKELEVVDPEAYARVDLKNARRVTRALEIALSDKKQNDIIYDNTYNTTWIGLRLNSEDQRSRIQKRLQERFDLGMLDEARSLLRQGVTLPRMEELGLEYRYMARHLEGKLSYAEMVEQLESEIYKYAKRQMTWFKRNTDIKWFDADSPTLQAQVSALFS